MRVITPAMKLDVHLTSSEVKDGNIVMSGMSGVMQCETVMHPKEVFQLMKLMLKAQIIKVLFKQLFTFKK
ncbi:hypothetical protein ACOYR1_07175 [Thalassotalea piscium]